MKETKVQTGTQRYDAFFKNIFKNSISSFLDVLNMLSQQNFGNKILTELSEEVSKGLLRADLIAKTESNFVLLFEFKNEIKINAYFAINAYTFTHIHTSKAYKNVLAESEKTGAAIIRYVPIIVGFSIQRKYKRHLTRFGIIKETNIHGVYVLETNPYYTTFMFVLNEINFARVIQSIAIKYETFKKYAEILKEVDKTDFWTKARKDPLYKQVGLELINHFGELVLMIKHDVKYFRETYKFANLYVPTVAKSILDLAVIIFMKRKVDEIMSLAEVLTMEEKKKIIETFGVEAAIQAFGVEKVIEAVGVEKVVDILGRILNLSEEEKKKLLMRYKKKKQNKK